MTFKQADIPKNNGFYIELTTYFSYGKVKDVVLKINNSLNVKAEVPRMWYENLKS